MPFCKLRTFEGLLGSDYSKEIVCHIFWVKTLGKIAQMLLKPLTTPQH